MNKIKAIFAFANRKNKPVFSLFCSFISHHFALFYGLDVKFGFFYYCKSNQRTVRFLKESMSYPVFEAKWFSGLKERKSAVFSVPQNTGYPILLLHYQRINQKPINW